VACRELRHQSKAAFQVFTFTSPIFTGKGAACDGSIVLT
jgi:hypothetical protein